jgi:uroporphyrinogen III methyltransferase/synthase
MGVGRLGEIAQELIDCGRDPDEPSAVIERGTLPGQRSVVAPLSRLAEEVAAAGIKPPAITVVGHVSKLAERIGWLQNRPLNGLRVVVTRARPQASGLADHLAELGAEPLQLPAIRIEPTLDTDEVATAVQAIDAYSLICLTSPNGANLLFEALAAAGKDARSLAGATVAAIGPGTADALRSHGVIPDVVPEKFVAEELVVALDQAEVEGKRVLVARAAEARDVLPDALKERNAEVDVVALYRTVAEELDDGTIAAAGDADYVTFTSSSTVKNLLAALPGGSLPGSPRVVSIGPVTSETAREAGLEVDVEATRHDIDGLIEALVADATELRS